MKLRVGITIVSIILYTGLFNLYIFEFLRWTPYFDRVFYNCLTGGAICFAVIDWKAGFVNDYHKQFNTLLFLCIITNYVFILLKLFEVFNPEHPQPMFYSFDVSICLITLTIFYNEIKYKIMTD